MHLDEELEAVAEGGRDLTPDERAHLAQCAECTRALALATQVHLLLQSQSLTEAPADFVGAMRARVRRERWRAEQRLDFVFNLVVVCAALLGVVGIWLVLSASGLSPVSSELAVVLVDAVNGVVRQSLPALPTYALAVTVFLSGLAVWWWAERGFEL
jgi:hypothetical protein